MSTDKIYLISVAASGKSTFASKFPYFEGYKIVDFAEQLPRRTAWTKIVLYLSRVAPILKRRLRQDMIAVDADNYFHNLSAYLTRQTEPTVVLGRRPPENLDEYDAFEGVQLAMVLIPEKDHRRNCEVRKRQLRNSLPFFRHYTANFEKVLMARKNSIEYAARNNVPVYESFSAAVKSIARNG